MRWLDGRKIYLKNPKNTQRNDQSIDNGLEEQNNREYWIVCAATHTEV